jgi:PPP family 3-phenylpropionic acid transporter
VYPIADAYCYEIIEHNPRIQYGRIRLMGNIGYAIGALLLGQIIQYYGLRMSYFIYSYVMIIGSVMIAKVKFSYKHTREKININDGFKLIKDKRYLILIISAIICNIAIGGNVSYLAILIQRTGGNTGNLGFVWFLIALSALPVLYYGKRLITKFNKLNIYLLGIMFYALRFFLVSVFDSFHIIIIIQLLESVSYPLVLLGALEYLNKITPSKVKTTSMTFYTAAYGVGGFIGNITGGIILENASIFLLYRVLSIISVIGCIVVLILKKTDRMISTIRQNNA